MLPNSCRGRHRRSTSADTSVANVVSRGQQRTERRRVAIGIGVVVVHGRHRDRNHPGSVQARLAPRATCHRLGLRRVATPSVTIAGEPPSDELTPVTRIDSNMLWNVVEPGSTEALGSVIWDNSAVANQKAPYLAWSIGTRQDTEPGVRSDPVSIRRRHPLDSRPEASRSPSRRSRCVASGPQRTDVRVRHRGGNGTDRERRWWRGRRRCQ